MALAARGADAANIGEMVESFEAHYARTVGTQATLFRGTLEGLRALRSAGRQLAVVTNKPRVFTETLLAKLGILEFFSAIVAGDDGVARKPSGDMLVAACEADGHAASSKPSCSAIRKRMSAAARAAGCPVWCVPYGYNEGRDPATLACDRIVATVEEAARLLVNAT